MALHSIVDIFQHGPKRWSDQRTFPANSQTVFIWSISSQIQLKAGNVNEPDGLLLLTFR